MNLFPASAKAGAFLERVRESLPSLGLAWGGGSQHDWASQLAMIGDAELFGNPIRDASMAAALRCGLLVRADLFDEPHSICQEVQTATGSYWHGICHRREPDFGNSRYWFHRVGDHPLFQDLYQETLSLAERHGSEWRGPVVEEILKRRRWDSFLLIELSEACHEGRRPELLRELESLQELEIDFLLRFSYHGAVGGSRRDTQLSR